MFAGVLLILAICAFIIPFTNSFETLAAAAAVMGLFQVREIFLTLTSISLSLLLMRLNEQSFSSCPITKHFFSYNLCCVTARAI